MAYPIEVFDYEILTDVPAGTTHTWSVGGNWEPGDIRLHFLGFNNQGTQNGSLFIATPAALTTIYSKNLTSTSSGGPIAFGVYSEVLSQSSTDYLSAITGTGGLQFDAFYYAAITLRHAYQQVAITQPPLQAVWTTSAGPNSSGTVPTATITTPGVAVFFGAVQGAGISAISGYTQLIDSGNSGANYGTGSTDNGLCIQAATFSTGTSIPANTFNFNGAVYYSLVRVYVQQAPDVTVNVATATAEVDTAGVVTPTLQNLVTVPVGTAYEVDTAGQVFTPLSGYRMSGPLLLPGDPVSASRVTWSAQTSAVGSQVHVLTSIDNGATWQQATNGGPVPNLFPGNTSTKTVVTKVIIERAAITDPTPRVTSLEVDVSCDAGNDELVSLGVFIIQETDITLTGGTTGGSGGSSGGGDGVTGSGGGNTGGGLTLQVTGTDLSLAVARNTWNDVFYVPYGTLYSDAIQSIIDDRLPGCTFNFASTVETTPQLIFGTEQSNDPWQDAQDLATAIGYELFFDANGVCTLRPIPDPKQGVPVWEFNDGMNPTVVSVVRTLTDQTTYNYIVVTGESTSGDTPVSAISYDNDPNSPTYINGPYGVKSYMWTSAEILTTAQAQAAADALLANSLGVSDQTVLTNVPMPALEPGDIVAVNVTEVKASGNYLLNAVTTPLAASQAQESTVYRQQ